MDQLSVPIPDGLADQRKAELSAWFADLALQVAASASALDAEPGVRAQALRRIRQGLAEIEAGQGVDGHQAMRRIAKRYGLSVPE